MDVGGIGAPDRVILDHGHRKGQVVLTQVLNFGTLLAVGGLEAPSVIRFRAQAVLPSDAGDQLLAPLMRPEVGSRPGHWSPWIPSGIGGGEPGAALAHLGQHRRRRDCAHPGECQEWPGAGMACQLLCQHPRSAWTMTNHLRAGRFQAVLKAARLKGSIGRVASAGNSTSMESFWALPQRNALNSQSWRTREDLCYTIVTWIEHSYNRR